MGLKDLENRSIYIIREAYAEFEKPAVLWSTGKDSTAVLWLCRKAFFGKIPFPVIHIDSVPSYSPLIIRRNGVVEITSIEDLWQSIKSPSIKTRNKEEIKKTSDIEVYSGWGHWAPIKHIIRHFYRGKIIRISTLAGAVDVSPNHSIIKTGGGGAVDANSVKIGDRLAVSQIYPTNYGGQGRRNGFFIGTEELAWLYGFFCAEGSASITNAYKTFKSYRVFFSNKNLKLLEKVKEIFEAHFHHELRLKEAEDACNLEVTDREIYQFLRNNFYTWDEHKKVPISIFMAPKNIKLAFLRGYDEGDGGRTRKTFKGSFDAFTSKSQPLLMGLAWLVRETNFQSFSVHLREDNPNITQILFNKSSDNKEDIRKVKKIIQHQYEGYLYDLGTKDHTFYTGVGMPIKVHNTSYKFKQMYEFRDRVAEEWGMDLVVARNKDALKAGMGPEKGKLECCTALKTQALMKTLEEHEFDALLLAIRRDEHGIRAKERVFSERDKNFRWDYRNQPLEMWDQYQSVEEKGTHIRVHPILHWRELDVWEYIKQEKTIPVNPMYFAKKNKRYRSLGCEPCTSPIDSRAKNIDEIVEELRTTKIAERSGRAQDKEKAFMMQKLRALGYM